MSEELRSSLRRFRRARGGGELRSVMRAERRRGASGIFAAGPAPGSRRWRGSRARCAVTSIRREAGGITDLAEAGERRSRLSTACERILSRVGCRPGHLARHVVTWFRWYHVNSRDQMKSHNKASPRLQVWVSLAQ